MVRSCRVPQVRLRGCLPERVISVVNRPCSDPLLPAVLKFGCAAVNPNLRLGNQPIVKARQDAGHRLDGFQSPELGVQDSLVEDLPSLASMLAAGHCDLEPKRLYSDHHYVKRLAGTMEPYRKLTVSPISAVRH